MTGEEQTAAAERVRRCKQDGPDAAYNHCPGESYIDDCDLLALAWLTEHPADDAEPVDAEWANGIGWASSYNFHWPTGDRAILLVVTHDAKPVLLYAGRVVAEPATRGHVRRLAATLGLTLTVPA